MNRLFVRTLVTLLAALLLALAHEEPTPLSEVRRFSTSKCIAKRPWV